MKTLIEKWRARAAVEARQCIADVYLECAKALELAEKDRIDQLVNDRPDFRSELRTAAAKINAHALDNAIMAGRAHDLAFQIDYIHDGAGTYTADTRPPAAHDIDPAHALPAERL